MTNEDFKIVDDIYSKVPKKFKKGLGFLENNHPNVNENELDIVDFSTINIELILDIFKLISDLKQYEKGDIDNYISFTRFVEGKEKISCDWCSICNGAFEMLYDTISDVCDSDVILSLYIPKSLFVQFNIYKSFFLNHKDYFPLAYDKDRLKVLSNKLNLNKENKKQILIKIKLILKMLNGIEQIERRWCPFKHMKKLKFNRDYYMYDSHKPDEVKLAIDLIKKEGKINKQPIIKQNNIDHEKGFTVFDGFMEYIEKIITI